ncbi:MAG TPA: 50S ribosomal protein L3 [Bdellovibrionota bacterium]|nr:50S ribosomal protein L3 [Bdellovibrionota bacterium]
MSEKSNSFLLLGKKIGMTQIFKEDGTIVPVTAVEVGPNVVLQKKTLATDGYSAVQLGFDDKKKQRVLKPEAGHATKAKTEAKRFVREVRLTAQEIESYEVGQVLTAANFQVGDRVDVGGISIGKGFQGVMKRHGFAGFPASHGTHEFFRHGGSIGNRSKPGKVFKNKRMAGHMGAEKITTQNLTIEAIEADKNIVLVRGSVPGHKGGYVTIKASVKGGFAKRDFAATAAPAAEAPAAE